LKGNVQSDGKKQKWEKSLICKRLPECKAQREAYKSELLFRNEVQFYTKILPEFQKFQKSKSTDFQFNAVPLCYLARNDLLILEDLCVRNFEMADRIVGLSCEQMVKSITELARFHALSLAFKEEHPEKFRDLCKLIFEGIFSAENAEWYKNYYQKLTKNSIEMVSKFLISIFRRNLTLYFQVSKYYPDDSQYVVKLKEFSDSLFLKMVNLLAMDTKLGVITHGDCWTNNILYKYNDKHEVVDTCLVDFQLIRHGSLALDLANIIFCCTDAGLRKSHMDQFLRVYCKELALSLTQLLGHLPEFCPNEYDLQTMVLSDFQKFGNFGLGLSFDILPISTCSIAEAPDLFESSAEETSETPILNVKINDLCQKKMSELVKDLVDNGMI
jgi:Ecdysteroid kinase-like family